MPTTSREVPCRIVGPYYPIGEVDWMCRTHDVPAVLRDRGRLGAKDLRREDFICPESGGIPPYPEYYKTACPSCGEELRVIPKPGKKMDHFSLDWSEYRTHMKEHNDAA
jgi:hypothetical protein